MAVIAKSFISTIWPWRRNPPFSAQCGKYKARTLTLHDNTTVCATVLWQSTSFCNCAQKKKLYFKDLIAYHAELLGSIGPHVQYTLLTLPCMCVIAVKRWSIRGAGRCVTGSRAERRGPTSASEAAQRGQTEHRYKDFSPWKADKDLTTLPTTRSEMPIDVGCKFFTRDDQHSRCRTDHVPPFPIDTTVDSGFGSHEADTPAVADDWAAQLQEINWFCSKFFHQPDKKVVLPNSSQWRTGNLVLHSDLLALRDSEGGTVTGALNASCNIFPV